MVDISSLHVPPGDAPRRQNRSCDQCRSTKRRCLVSTTGDSRGRVKCTTCKRLGHECTFNFARSQSTKSKKQRNGHDTLQRAESDGPIGVASDVFTQSAAPFLHGCETANGSQDPWESGVGFPAPWPDNSPPSFDAFFNGLEPTFTPAPPEDDVSNVMPHGASSHPPGQSVPDQLLRASSQMVARCGVPHSSAIAWSRPLLLLNSSLTGKIVDEHLARIYNAIVAGNSSRWLQCELSSPAKGYRAAIQGNAVSPAYPISDEPWNNLLDGMLYPVVMAALPPSHQALPETIEAVEPTTNLSTSDMTLLGAVRFLDHFSGMYGNKLGPLAKHLSDTALRDVLKIYAMQWLPAKHDSKLGQARSRPQNHDTLNTSTSSMSALYHDAWFCAKTSIGRARYVRSFRVVYATLLFDATAAPEQLQDWHDSKSSLLDHAFSTLRELAFLIRRYVKALGSLSIYGMMLEKGLELIEFFSYLRDTVSSLIDDRRCKVPDDLAKGIPQTSLDSLGNSPAQYQIDHFNRRCFSRLLMTLRKMMAVKKAYVEAIPRDHQTPGEHHGSLLSSAFEVIDEMETLLRPVIDASIKGFDSLEAEFKVQILALSAIWSLGLLSFSEISKDLSRNDCDVDTAATLPKLHSCQWTAGSCLAQLMRCVSAQPSLEVFNQANGLDVELPMTGYHLTTELMVTSLRQAIEKLIDLRHNADFDLTSSQDLDLGVIVEEQWKESIDYLMKGLLSLDVTVGAAQAVICASHDLIRAYGDILSDCWSADFET